MMNSLAAALLAAAAGCASAKDSQSFLVIGDWGGASDADPTTPGEVDNNKGMGAAAAALGDVSYVLAVGDNFYYAGINSSAERSPRFDSTFESVFTAPSLQVPWYVLAGNHDHKGNVTAEIAYSSLSTRWTFPAYYYTFVESFAAAGNKTITTQIVMIDTVLMTGLSYHDEETGEFVKPNGPEDPKLAEAQLSWLEDTLSKSTADYLWVAGHYPILSQCMHGPTPFLLVEVLPMLRKYNASGYIAGHDHCLGHFEYAGQTLVLSGAGKECCYAPGHTEVLPPGSMKFNMDAGTTYGADAGFSSLTVTNTSTTVRYYDSHGNVLYVAFPVPPRKLL
ncbi:Purple acid phosphatase 7 [Diplonema papillatum]|nr:Purple acid phosphatase 7 [Diplonema papillatum]